MDKSLSLFHQAYSLLLEGSMFNEMKNPPIDSISVKQVSYIHACRSPCTTLIKLFLHACTLVIQLTSNMQRLLKKAPPQAVQKKVASAIQIAWEMLTLDPPAIVCKPERYTNAWHMKIGKKWKSHQFYDLVYYRPVMLYGAGSSVAVKGKVGNKKCLDRTKCVNQEEEYSTSESGEYYYAYILTMYAVCIVFISIHLLIIHAIKMKKKTTYVQLVITIVCVH